MKKLVLAVALCFCLTGLVRAEELSLSEALQKLPAMNQGIMYNIADSKIGYLSTIEIAKYKGFILEGGYNSENTMVAVVSYPILKLKDLGVELPILNLIEFNLGFGLGVKELFTKDAEFEYGLTATFIKVKF